MTEDYPYNARQIVGRTNRATSTPISCHLKSYPTSASNTIDKMITLDISSIKRIIPDCVLNNAGIKSYFSPNTSFLDDTIINFGMDHFASILNDSNCNGHRVYVFDPLVSDLFSSIETYKRFRDGKSAEKVESEFITSDIVVVPINNHSHWTAMIFYNPFVTLKNKPSYIFYVDSLNDYSLYGDSIYPSSTSPLSQSSQQSLSSTTEWSDEGDDTDKREQDDSLFSKCRLINLFITTIAFKVIMKNGRLTSFGKRTKYKHQMSTVHQITSPPQPGHWECGYYMMENVRVICNILLSSEHDLFHSTELSHTISLTINPPPVHVNIDRLKELLSHHLMKSYENRDGDIVDTIRKELIERIMQIRSNRSALS